MKIATCAAAALGLIFGATPVHSEERDQTLDRLAVSESLVNSTMEWDAETASGPSGLPGDQPSGRVYRPYRAAIVIMNGAGGGMLVRSQAAARQFRRSIRQDEERR